MANAPTRRAGELQQNEAGAVAPWMGFPPGGIPFEGGASEKGFRGGKPRRGKRHEAQRHATP